VRVQLVDRDEVDVEAFEAVLVRGQRLERRRSPLLKDRVLADFDAERGKTLTTEMGRVCKYLGLPECTPHGLRRAGAARAAAAGASHAHLMAMFGRETMTQPDRYIKRFERQRAAMRSMHLVGVPQRAPQRRQSTAA
jgi:integrase